MRGYHLQLLVFWGGKLTEPGSRGRLAEGMKQDFRYNFSSLKPSNLPSTFDNRPSTLLSKCFQRSRTWELVFSTSFASSEHRLPRFNTFSSKRPTLGARVSSRSRRIPPRWLTILPSFSVNLQPLFYPLDLRLCGTNPFERGVDATNGFVDYALHVKYSLSEALDSCRQFFHADLLKPCHMPFRYRDVRWSIPEANIKGRMLPHPCRRMHRNRA